MKNSVYDLEFSLIDTRYPSSQNRVLCEKAFFFWKESWEETYRGLNTGTAALFADDFLDRRAIVLSYDHNPVALFLVNIFDFSSLAQRHHSYFKNHPQEVMSLLAETLNEPVMVLSYMTLHAEWRRANTDCSIPDLLFSLAVKVFQESPCRFLNGYIRRDKSFSESFYRHGAQKILSTVAYNVPVDFCLLQKTQAHLSTAPGVANACNYLWSQFKGIQKNDMEVA